ncbi:hypothetical protein Tco_0508786 [Tanacetum coccineum]
MSSPKNSLSKLSKKPKISVRPVWKKKLNYYNSSNEVDVHSQTTMSKPSFLCNQSPNKNFPIAPSNQASILLHSPILLDSYVDVVLQANPDTNPTPPPPPPPPSLTRERLVDEINQLQHLSNLLAMHLSHRTTLSSSYSPNLSHTLNLNQVEYHVGYCPCCRYIQTQFLAIRKDLNWVKFLLTRPQPPLQIQKDYPPTTTSAPTSPPTSN